MLYWVLLYQIAVLLPFSIFLILTFGGTQMSVAGYRDREQDRLLDKNKTANIGEI